MLLDILFTVASLALILFACFLFTNAVEGLGKALKLGQGVVGSILAAVGTALPETVIPIIAIVVLGDAGSKEIGVGAIAGAPFMLSTLAFFVTGSAVLLYSLAGKRTRKMNADVKVLSRDLGFFLAIYTVAVLTTFIRQLVVVKDIIAVALLLSYALYVKRTLGGDSEGCEDAGPLFFAKLAKAKTNLGWILLQLIVALAGIVFGAQLFVGFVEDLAGSLHVAPLILSIIITPIATELPEKFNSVIWTGRKRDTLALGNITGAMVFQSCFPVVFGMVFTDWHLTGTTLISAGLAILSAGFNLAWMKIRKTVNPFALLISGALYAALMVYIFR